MDNISDLKFATPHARTQEKHIQAFEELVGCPFPEPYRRFLQLHNGGVPFSNAFDVYSPLENRVLYTYIIKEFLGVGLKDGMEKAYNLFKKDLPPFFVPIAFDTFTNLMILSLKTGEIYFWDCNFRVRKDKTNQILLWVCESFEDFLDSLYTKKYN